jgi:hypothetical protein
MRLDMGIDLMQHLIHRQFYSRVREVDWRLPKQRVKKAQKLCWSFLKNKRTRLFILQALL